MRSNLFVFSYLFANLFRVYEIYLFFETFFGKSERKKGKILCYILNFLVVSGEYLFIDIPMLTLSINVMFKVIFTFFYKADIKRKILGVGFANALFCLCEGLLIVLTGFFPFSMIEKGFYSSAVGMFCYPILPFIFVFLYRMLKKSKGDIKVPMSYCITVVCVPMFCMYIICLAFSFREIQMWQMISVVMVLFVMAGSVFVLYEKQMKFFSEENRKQVLEVQNVYYHKQMEYMMSAENTTRSLRHDMKNHLMSISALAKKNENTVIVKYVDKLYHLVLPAEERVSSGNVVIDSILNGKLTLAAEKGISLKVEAAIPTEFSMDEVDITILLGNLLDNAIENFDGTAGKEIGLHIRYDRGRLFINCENPYCGVLKQQSKFFYTIKADKKNHGFGLQNINNVVAEYHGEMKIEVENNIFRVGLMLYLP